MVRISLPVFNRELIKWLGLGHDSFIECLAANARTRDGLKASTVIIDEYSQARNSANKSGADLKNVLTSSMGTRKEPLTVIITAALNVIDGPFKHELDGVMKVLRGTPRLDCAIAFDLSVHDDFSAVSYTVWSKDDKKFYTHTDYYFPKGALKGHPNETIYRQWHEQGNLNFCKGDIIDMRQIASDIINNAKKCTSYVSGSTLTSPVSWSTSSHQRASGECSCLIRRPTAPSTYQWRPSSCLHGATPWASCSTTIL